MHIFSLQTELLYHDMHHFICERKWPIYWYTILKIIFIRELLENYFTVLFFIITSFSTIHGMIFPLLKTFFYFSNSHTFVALKCFIEKYLESFEENEWESLVAVKKKSHCSALLHNQMVWTLETTESFLNLMTLLELNISSGLTTNMRITSSRNRTVDSERHSLCSCLWRTNISCTASYSSTSYADRINIVASREKSRL